MQIEALVRGHSPSTQAFMPLPQRPVSACSHSHGDRHALHRSAPDVSSLASLAASAPGSARASSTRPDFSSRGAKLKPKIVVRTQPPNSPDTNMCDLSLFRALGVAVHKRRRMDSDLFNLHKLVEDVVAAYWDYDSATLDEMWEYKSYVMTQIAKDGGNMYPRHRRDA